ARQPRLMLMASRLAFAAGRLAVGIRYATLAGESAFTPPARSGARAGAARDSATGALAARDPGPAASVADSAAASAWAVAPWASPPAFDALFAAIPETTAPDSIDRALMQALVW